MIEEPFYRQDYIGEVVTDTRAEPAKRVFVKPRDIFHRDKGTAIVVGNGISRLNPTFDLMMRVNKKKDLPVYKIVYACNGAAWDVDADYYVVNNRVLMGHIRDKQLHSQFFVPWDMFLDYTTCNMIPLVQGLDAGSTAAFLAAFDGHDKVFLFGFEGQGSNYSNVYEGKPCYAEKNSAADANQWHENLRSVMKAFKNVEFYRVGAGATPAIWRDVPNFQDCNYAESVKLGDF